MNIQTMLADALKKIDEAPACMIDWYEGAACGKASVAYQLDIMTVEAYTSYFTLCQCHARNRHALFNRAD